MSGQHREKRIRRLSKRNKTAKGILRQVNKSEQAVLMATKLPNNITNALKKNEFWRRKLSIRQHPSPASRCAKLRPNKIYKSGN